MAFGDSNVVVDSLLIRSGRSAIDGAQLRRRMAPSRLEPRPHLPWRGQPWCVCGALGGARFAELAHARIGFHGFMVVPLGASVCGIGLNRAAGCHAKFLASAGLKRRQPGPAQREHWDKARCCQC